ncbi:MAG: D-Ala-D-Ala carboxypeptidase family metallohydrolase [Candidatus Cloacimonetes bacterium]|nr:D-Ala-D-Ala carboxypeptidase family metallohydrolase [Candidatus Cloacimonadota bacterium]
MARLSKNFTSEEFACKCGCGYDTPNPELIRMLQAARDLYGKPMQITSGCRCIKHNRNVGGAANSAHIQGMAVDIATPTGEARYEIINALMKSGFRRIGINFKKKFVHADIDESKPHPTIFSY